MKWTKPPLKEPSRDFHIVGDNGWLICKAHCGARVVYTLSHRGVLVRSSESLEELKELADEDCQQA